MYQRVELYGVRIDSITPERAVERALDEQERRAFVVTPNAQILSACRKDAKLVSLLNSATLSLPDGAGVLLAAKRCGTPLPSRVAGADFAISLLNEAEKRGLRVFLLGGKAGVAEAARDRLQKSHPHLCICGVHDGYFDFMGEENVRLLEAINRSHTDILFVCLGFPRQEAWISENFSRLPNVRVAAGLGGTLDVLAGKVKRAPASVSRMGLEWFWRMALQPKRLRHLPALIRFYLFAPH